jgi:hypothetical protein
MLNFSMVAGGVSNNTDELGLQLEWGDIMRMPQAYKTVVALSISRYTNVASISRTFT